jgi:signal transduction histidine kinase
MWLDVLALAPQPDKIPQAVETIRRNLARQARLVNELNDAARVAASGLETRSEPADAVALLERGLGAWRSLAAGKQLMFDHEIGLAAAPINGDPGRLSQAFGHVVESAIGSTPAGGRVAVRLYAAGGHCVIEVEDTGAALSAEDCANLGTPLFRSPASAKGRAGLGLGLAVAHHIMGKHGGALTATSGESGGNFRLTLPFAVGDREIVSVAQTDRTPRS